MRKKGYSRSSSLARVSELAVHPGSWLFRGPDPTAIQQKSVRYYSSLPFSEIGGGGIMLSCLRAGIQLKLNLESTWNLV